jgi:hypothetical protein
MAGFDRFVKLMRVELISGTDPSDRPGESQGRDRIVGCFFLYNDSVRVLSGIN